MKRKKLLYAFLILSLAAVGIIAAEDGLKQYAPDEKAFYLTAADAQIIRPGLNIKIMKVEFDPLPNVNVTFRISDDKDQGLDRAGINSPGEVSLSFYLARIKPGDSQYTNYRTTIQSSTITGKSTTVAAADSGGTYASLGDGVYRYTFGTKLPSNFESNATHTVAISGERILTEFGLGENIANALVNVVPSGAGVTQVREIVSNAACNQCHNPLGAHHSGSRQQVGLCILCHSPQSTDADTGNTIDFKVFIHKLHRGAGLPSVQAGTPYQIIRVSGGVNYVYDYSKVQWPQDVRNCTTCHQQASQADNWKKNPSRVACGSCHDNVDFASGKNHLGGAQSDDSRCSTCHTAEGQEFDISVSGAHTIPDFSRQLAGINLKILGVSSTNPGDKPTVDFSLTDNAGNFITLSDLNSFSLRIAGPVTDYTFNVSEDARSAKQTATGYSYTFKTNSIPANAKGTYAIGGEARRAAEITGFAGQPIELEEGNKINPILYFGVGGTKVEPRRQVTDIKNCDNCHKRLVLHGGTRQENPEYCAMCHNAATVDNPNGARNAGYKVPEGTVPQSINFRFMIHRIHSGEELSRDYTVYRSRGVFNFNEVVFPGDRRDCAKCHVNNSYQLPMSASMARTSSPREFYTPLEPAASACLGCHDSVEAAAHAFLNTAAFGESCAVCHREGAEFSVSKAHAR